MERRESKAGQNKTILPGFLSGKRILVGSSWADRVEDFSSDPSLGGPRGLFAATLPGIKAGGTSGSGSESSGDSS